jgi:hypothetical protein
MKFFFSTCICSIAFAVNINAQTPVFITLDGKNAGINWAAFNSVDVIDNRIDTTYISVSEDGTYPFITFNFDKPASAAIKGYLLAAIERSKKGNEKLFISVKQLKVPNNGSIERRSKKKFWFKHVRPGRNYLFFEAEVYRVMNSSYYQKLFTITKKYYIYSSIDEAVSRALDNLIYLSNIMLDPTLHEGEKLKSVRRLTDCKDCVLNAADTSVRDISQISIGALNRWATYPIIKDAVLADGIYSNFDDFRDGLLKPCSCTMAYQNNDSVYKISSCTNKVKSGGKWPWAICVGGELYMKLLKDAYVKLTKQNNTFHFYVPQSLPNMYELFSIDELQHKNTSSSPSSDNLLVGLTSAVVFGTIDAVVKNHRIRQIERTGADNFFRNCFIDMDSGDIIYH